MVRNFWSAWIMFFHVFLCNIIKVGHCLYRFIILLNLISSFSLTAQKMSKYGVLSDSYFPVFGLNMEIYEINFCIQSKYGKIQTRKNSVFGPFSYSSICICFLSGHMIAFYDHHLNLKQSY